MQTLTTTHDKMLGGRLIDMEIAKFLADGFKGGDIFAKPKALIKLLGAAEKAKKTLGGGIAKTRVYVECILNDQDLSKELTTEKLDSIMVRHFLLSSSSSSSSSSFGKNTLEEHFELSFFLIIY